MQYDNDFWILLNLMDNMIDVERIVPRGIV